jgi:hypothetical protein
MLFLLGTITSCLPEREVTQIKIDVNQTNAPIEKYIYGQFIEHLGKCIYGGIWAEMLEDRKFYYPVTYEFNPWATGEDEYWESGEFTFLNASPGRLLALKIQWKWIPFIHFAGNILSELMLPEMDRQQV